MSKVPRRLTRTVENNSDTSDIPTAVNEDNPFDDGSKTNVDIDTDDPEPSSDLESTDRELEKFRRPTPAEIAQAVDLVNTDAISINDFDDDSDEVTISEDPSGDEP